MKTRPKMLGAHPHLNGGMTGKRIKRFAVAEVNRAATAALAKRGIFTWARSGTWGVYGGTGT